MHVHVVLDMAQEHIYIYIYYVRNVQTIVVMKQTLHGLTKGIDIITSGRHSEYN